MTNTNKIFPDKHSQNYLINFSDRHESYIFRENTVRFRLIGVPHKQAIKIIQVDPNDSITEVKRKVQREYKLNSILAIQFVFRGKVLPENLKFSEIGILQKNEVITIISVMSGAAHFLQEEYFMDNRYNEKGGE